MKYHIYWQNQHGIWQKFLTKTNEADTYRTMKRRAKATNLRHKMTDSNGGWILQCAICSSDGRDTAGVSLSKLLKEHDPRLHQEWEDSWEAIANLKRTIEKPFLIKNRKDGQKKTYE